MLTADHGSPTCTSWVARITDVHHHTWTLVSFFLPRWVSWSQWFHPVAQYQVWGLACGCPLARAYWMNESVRCKYIAAGEREWGLWGYKRQMPLSHDFYIGWTPCLWPMTNPVYPKCNLLLHRGLGVTVTFFLFGVEFELRASHLLGRSSTAWAMLPAFFALVILQIWSHFLPRLAWTMIFLF
jgi:hypothetical protein